MEGQGGQPSSEWPMWGPVFDRYDNGAIKCFDSGLCVVCYQQGETIID